MAGNVVIVGSINMDVITMVDAFPQPGETVLSDGYVISPGGKGANQAVAAARLGASTSIVGCVGSDNYGTTIMQWLKGAGVNREFVIKDASQPSGLALVIVDSIGENRIVVSPGANMKLPVQHVMQAIEQLNPNVLVLQLEIPLETVIAAATEAQRSGAMVILNAAPVQQLPEELLASVDILVVNETERDALASYYCRDDAKPKPSDEALRRLVDVERLVVTKGAGGATIIDAGSALTVDGIPIVAVDTTGAGDAFVGGLATAMSEGQTLPESVRFANAAGALACCQMGAQESLPSRDDVRRVLVDPLLS